MPNSLINTLEGRYIYTASSAWRPIKAGFVTAHKPVIQNHITIGTRPIEINLFQHCTLVELQELLAASISQVQYERWYNDQLKELERIAG